jgi:hypothetical protein
VPVRLPDNQKYGIVLLGVAAATCIALSKYIAMEFAFIGMILLLVFFYFAPLLIVHPLYYTYGKNHRYHLQMARQSYRGMHPSLGSTDLQPKPSAAAVSLSNLTPKATRSVPQGTVAIGVFTFANRIEAVEYAEQNPAGITKGHAPLDVGKCDRAFIIANAVRMPIHVETDEYITDSRVFMNPADMKELGVARGDDVAIEAYFGKGTPSMLSGSERRADWIASQSGVAPSFVKEAIRKMKP